MARTNIDSTYMLPDSDGAASPSPVAADTTNGNVFTNDGKIVLAVVNSNGTTAANVTFPFPAYLDVDGVAVPDKTVSIPASATRYFRLPTRYYGDQAAVDGTVDLSFYLIR